ncbi:3-oxoacyl-[acyl-carrier-protein] synthase III C-terminal domain-containing protein [Nocardiopsis terrae]
MNTSIGIGSIHCLLPVDRTPVHELPELETITAEEADFATGSGITTVGVFDGTAPTDLAIRACQGLGARLRESEQPSPDTLVLAAGRAPDVLLGSDAGRLQAESGFEGAFSFTVDGLGCTGSSAAWSLAADLLRADPSRRSVAIAHASRPAAIDRVRYPVTVIGDGAYAMTMVRGGRPALVAHRMESDGSFHDLFSIDYKQVPWYEWHEECSSADRYRFELAMHSRQRLSRMVDEVLAEAGVGREGVAATLMQNVTSGAFDFYETLLGLPIHSVCRDNLDSLGHLGAMDVVLNLEHLLSTDELAEGDLVLVLNNSPVAAWAVTAWRV